MGSGVKARAGSAHDAARVLSNLVVVVSWKLSLAPLTPSLGVWTRMLESRVNNFRGIPLGGWCLDV